jgi:serine phosphatase RsbU (regulator of sigma subunit)
MAVREAIEATLMEQFAQTRYATAILADLDTVTGRLAWINRGHHPPILIRDGRRTTYLVHAVLEHHAGTLTDDATVMLCEWRGGPYVAAAG